MPKVVLRCVCCGWLAGGFACHCPACDGLVDAAYAQTRPPAGDTTADSIDRYWSTLPLHDRASCRLALPPTPLIELVRVRGDSLLVMLTGGPGH